MTLRFKRAVMAAAAAVIVLGTAELGLRLAGVVDFPLYDVDGRIGYIPRANQSGAFLGRNHWRINEKSQGSGPWRPDRKADLLLLGDSVVWGGNLLDQPEKLGPTLARRWSDVEVWSASAGSWGVLNEVEYMDRFPEVVAASDYLVWVLNAGDLGPRSQWASETKHPQHRPASALWYALKKYGWPRLRARFAPSPKTPPAPAGPPPVLPETEAVFHDRLTALAARMRVVVVIWPERAAAAGDAAAQAAHQRFSARVRSLVPPQVRVLDVLEVSPPPAEAYRDGIHPGAAGNEYLADRIADVLRP